MGKTSKNKGKVVETWKDIPGYEGLYQASTTGKIRSCPRRTTRGGEMSLHKHKNGYVYVVLSKNGQTKNCRVHLLIATTFLGKKTDGLQINHIDGDKSNNSPENLEYCTQSENMKHAYKNGLQKPIGKKVINLETKEIYENLTDAARTFSKAKCGGEMIARVCRGERSHYKNKRFAFYSDYINNTIPEYKGKSKRKASFSLWV